MNNNAPIWIIGPPRSRTKWAVNLFKDIPEHIILNHPSFGIYSPFWWRYNKIPPLDAIKEIDPILNNQGKKRVKGTYKAGSGIYAA